LRFEKKFLEVVDLRAKEAAEKPDSKVERPQGLKPALEAEVAA
jgi:hypothetical protein